MQKEYIIISTESGSKSVAERASHILTQGEPIESIAVKPIDIDTVAIAIGSSKPEIVAILSDMTYPEVSALECAMAIENGADQVEIAIHGHQIGAEQQLESIAELRMITEEIEDEATLTIRIEKSIEANEANAIALLHIAEECGASALKIASKNSIWADRFTELIMGQIAKQGSAITLKSISFDGDSNEDNCIAVEIA